MLALFIAVVAVYQVGLLVPVLRSAGGLNPDLQRRLWRKVSTHRCIAIGNHFRRKTADRTVLLVAIVGEGAEGYRTCRVVELHVTDFALKHFEQVAVEQRNVVHFRSALHREAIVDQQSIFGAPADANKELGGQGVLHGGGARVAGEQLQQLALLLVTIGRPSGGGILPLLEEKAANLAGANEGSNGVGGGLATHGKL